METSTHESRTTVGGDGHADETEFDIFISYSNEKLCRWWVETLFEPLLIERFAHNEGRKPVIFRDRTSIRGGDEWAKAIQEALVRSKTFVAVLSAMYFQSSWCTWEWEVFQAKQKAIGLNSTHPLKVADGHKIVKAIPGIQLIDYSEFFFRGDWNDSPQYFELQRRINALSLALIEQLYRYPAEPVEWELPREHPDPSESNPLDPITYESFQL